MERAVADAIDEIECLLKTEEDDAFMLGDTDFSVESVWLPDLKKHHIAIRDLKRDEDWVATIVLEDQPTMTVEEVKSTLESSVSTNTAFTLSE